MILLVDLNIRCHKRRDVHGPCKNRRMRIRRTLLGHNRQKLALVKLNRLTGGKILCHDDHRLRHCLRAYLRPVQDGDQTVGNIMNIRCTSPHIVVVHTEEHGCHLLAGHKYRILCIHPVIFDDAGDGLIVIQIVQKHLVNVENHCFFFSHVNPCLLIESF